jgi:enoyl-CoA hydratase/carnithine racemase
MADVGITWPTSQVALLTMSTGPRNFSNWELQERLEQALAEIRYKGARVVILASAVDGYFIAHGSISNLLDTFVDRTASGDPMAAIRVQKELESSEMVAIAAIDGQAWGGGAELALACDLRVVSTAATFAFHEIRVGTTPAGGATRVAWLVSPSLARRMVLDGRPILGEEAYRVGLADRLTAPGEAISEAITWAEWLASHPPGALARSKEAVNRIRSLPYREALRMETQGFVERFSDPEFIERLRQVQARYDEGADSYEAFELLRENR